MKYYSVVGFIVVLALSLSDVYGRHRRDHGSTRRHHHHKHSRLFNNMNHLSRFKNHRRLSHQRHLHLQGVSAGLKCRRAKFIINQRHPHRSKEENDAAKRHIKKKHATQLLHKFVKNNKRFRLPKETKLFEDKEGRLITYIEDCVDSGHADKKDLFGDQTEVFIAPGVGHSKKRHHQHSSENNRGSSRESHESAIGEEDILPASEDSLLQTVSDSNEILKDNAQKEGAAQFINDQHDTEIPSNFATVFQAATLDNPLPKKPEEGSEMQKFFNAANVETIHLPPLPESDEGHSQTNGLPAQSDATSEGNAVTPISNQPVNIPMRQHNNQLTFTSAAQNAGITPSLGTQEIPGLRQQRFGAWNNMRMDQLASAFPGLQNAGITTLGNQGNADVTSEVLRNPGPSEYTSQLRNQEIAHAQFAEASLGEPGHATQFPDTSLSEPAYSFTDAFERLKNPEAMELASIVNNGPIPQTLEGAMKEDKEEASYENKFEKVFGKSNALGMQKGAAYLPQRQNN